MLVQSTDPVEKYIYSQKRRIIVGSLVLGLLFLGTGILSGAEGKITTIVGLAFLLIFGIQLVRGDKIIESSMKYYHDKPGVFKVLTFITKVINYYIWWRLVFLILWIR